MPRSPACYCCRNSPAVMHSDYPRLCESCGAENLLRRHQKADLTGVIALVTGARVKIGHHTALRLLRNGATVVATSRFPLTTREVFQAAPDYETWRDRLMIRGLELARPDLIGDFIGALSSQVPYLDVLINNAAQTVKDVGVLRQDAGYELALRAGLPAPGGPTPFADPHALVALPNAMVLANDQAAHDWVKRSTDVSLRDLLEVQIINVTSPYLLAVGLRDMLAASPHRNRFVVNVSSLEGKFTVRKKSSAHPHTNMAKAALNMMTKTLAGEYKRDRIFTYSIDPGWVSHQFPHGRPSRDQQLPLDFDDAAARLTQPLFEWRDADRPPTGIFLKDFQETPW